MNLYEAKKILKENGFTLTDVVGKFNRGELAGKGHYYQDGKAEKAARKIELAVMSCVHSCENLKLKQVNVHMGDMTNGFYMDIEFYGEKPLSLSLDKLDKKAGYEDSRYEICKDNRGTMYPTAENLDDAIETLCQMIRDWDANLYEAKQILRKNSRLINETQFRYNYYRPKAEITANGTKYTAHDIYSHGEMQYDRGRLVPDNLNDGYNVSVNYWEDENGNPVDDATEEMHNAISDYVNHDDLEQFDVEELEDLVFGDSAIRVPADIDFYDEKIYIAHGVCANAQGTCELRQRYGELDRLEITGIKEGTIEVNVDYWEDEDGNEYDEPPEPGLLDNLLYIITQEKLNDWRLPN